MSEALAHPRHPGLLPAVLSSAWPQPGRQPVLMQSSRHGWLPGLLRLAEGVGEGGWLLRVEVGPGVGEGAEAHYMREGRWL
jgi:hypothetical protein